MKGVLRWLFGPGFEFSPSGTPPDLYGADGSVIDQLTWQRVSRFGEFVKFLHQAIEWENMVYVLYPYFWSNTADWEFKKYLTHPDPLHRSFLKAGSARVVLTIRPGFEADFLSVIETGVTGGLPSTHPYVKISDELRAFADTNFPGVPPANTATDVRPLISPRQNAAWRDIQVLMALLERFHSAQSRYPTEGEGLAALGEYVDATIPSVPMRDPWGNAYAYKCPGLTRDYEVASLGADGAPGGSDENADIASFATSNLIGVWFEYTPTSAMDIDFGAVQPEA